MINILFSRREGCIGGGGDRLKNVWSCLNLNFHLM